LLFQLAVVDSSAFPPVLIGEEFGRVLAESDLGDCGLVGLVDVVESLVGEWRSLDLTGEGISTIYLLLDGKVVMCDLATSGVFTSNTESFIITILRRRINLQSQRSSIKLGLTTRSVVSSGTSNWQWITSCKSTTLSRVKIGKHGRAVYIRCQSFPLRRCNKIIRWIMNASWVVEIFDGRSTIIIQSNSTVNHLTNCNLIGQGLLQAAGDLISVGAGVADGYVWITVDLCLTDSKMPRRRGVDGEQSIEWSNERSAAIALSEGTCLQWT
jgi:hypothetical protein